MSSDNNSSNSKYESEFALMPLGKILSVPVIMATWFLPHMAMVWRHGLDEIWNHHLPFACGVSIASMTVCLTVRMSMFRAEMMSIDSTKLIEKTDRFQRWHKAQQNNVEYYPLFVSLLLYRQTLPLELSLLGRIGCIMAWVGNYGFVFTSCMLYGSNLFLDSPLERVLRKLGFSRFFRVFSILFRYISLGIILTDLALSF